MKYLQSGYKGTHDEVIVYPIGDIHIGSPHYNPKVVKKHLKEIEKNRENSRILLMGDLIECATKNSVGAGVYEQTMTPEEQVEEAIKLFEPYKDLIDGAVLGNHEFRAFKDTGVDLMKSICRGLGIVDRYMGYYGVVNIAWNSRSYHLAVWHGAGGGSSVSGALNKLKKQRNVVLADIYLMGHFHRRTADTEMFLVPDPYNKNMRELIQYFVITGSALGWEGSYAEMAGLNPQTPGFPKIILGGKIYSQNGKRFTKKVKVIL